MPILHLFAPAKINVYLRITGRRPDGYHLLDSLMIPVSLCDELRLEVDRQLTTGNSSCQLSVSNTQHLIPNTQAEAAGGASRIVLTCDEPTLPVDETNLAYKAAALVFGETGRQATISIHLQKRIPAGAGLGGGSSDAAAVLKGVNQLCELGLSDDQLCQLAARLGADAPFFIPCRPARVEGIGEVLTPLPPLPHRWIVLVVPPFGVSTPWAYQRFDELSIERNALHPVEHTIPGQWPADAALANDLERAVFPDYPRIAEIKSALLRSGAEGALMSGSGSSVFGLFSQRTTAERAREVLENYGKIFLLEPLTGPPSSS